MATLVDEGVAHGHAEAHHPKEGFWRKYAGLIDPDGPRAKAYRRMLELDDASGETPCT